MISMYEITQKVKNIYEELENGIGIDEETGEIKPEIMQALQISKNELETKAVDYCYVIKAIDDDIECYDKEIKRLTERKKQFTNIQNRLKEVVKNAMIEFDIPEIKGKTLKINFRKSESVEVLDLSALEERFKRTKITIEPDKTAIKEAIKNGEVVEGAILVEKSNLQIK